jgi:predicted peroxiredoxin
VKVTYLASAGTGDPTRASLPLHLAVNGSAEVRQDVEVVLLGDGAELVIGDTAERLEGVGVPPVRDLLAKLRDHAIPVYV